MDTPGENRLILKRAALFFVLSMFAWVIWVPQALRHFGLISWAPSLNSPLNALTVWSPGLAAILLTFRAAGKEGVVRLFGLVARWRVPLKWYVAALFIESGKWAAALGIDRLLGRSYALEPGILISSFSSAAAYMMPVAIVFALPNALGEELGWRGFVLPKLQGRYGALAATVIIGIFWGFWHVPAWLAWDAVEFSWLPILIKVVHALPAAVIFTWIFNNTGNSLLMMCLYHASITTRWYLLPPIPTSTEKILTWGVAVLIVILTNRSTFRRERARV